jgi:hypothetical protein
MVARSSPKGPRLGTKVAFNSGAAAMRLGVAVHERKKDLMRTLTLFVALRRLPTLTLAVLALTLVPALASAQTGGGGNRAYCAPAGPPERGQCSFSSGQVTFDFDASSGPAGESPVGSGIFVVFPGDPGEVFANYDITCLQVTANLASFGGVITDSNIWPVGSGISFTVVDNPTGPDLISQGTVSFEGPPSPDTPGCGDANQGATPLEQGDIVVQGACDKAKDKPGTDKDKCKTKH